MAYLCKSGVGLATAMLELLRLEGVGDFGPSTLECPWDPVNEVRCRRTSTSLLLLWNALLLHRLLFESQFEASCFLKGPRRVSTKCNWTPVHVTRTNCSDRPGSSDRGLFCLWQAKEAYWPDLSTRYLVL